jgi:nucleoside-diphosphate-sugar epimerase
LLNKILPAITLLLCDPAAMNLLPPLVGLLCYCLLGVAQRAHTFSVLSRTPAPPSPAFTAHLAKLRARTSAQVDPSIQSRRFLVIGGTGFTGGYLVDDLLARGAAHVSVLSRRGAPKNDADRRRGVLYLKGSISDPVSLRAAFVESRADVVFHTAASYGWPPFSRYGEASRARTWAINVGGMENIIEASRAAGVELLVYTSSCNVVFDGVDRIAVDESAPYASEASADGRPISGFARDHYTVSKAEAERRCLGADETIAVAEAVALTEAEAVTEAGPETASERSGPRSSASGAAADGAAADGTGGAERPRRSLSGRSRRPLRTVALRPNGIYGPGESFFSPKSLAAGFILGSVDFHFGLAQRADFSFVYNLAWAHALVVSRLDGADGAGASQGAGAFDAVGGKAFFITDGEGGVTNTAAWGIFRPTFERLGVHVRPRLEIPGWLLRSCADGLERLFHAASELVPWLFDGAPPLTSAEASKATRTHTHSIARAREAFGYEPVVSLQEGAAFTAEEMARRLGVEDAGEKDRTREFCAKMLIAGSVALAAQRL